MDPNSSSFIRSQYNLDVGGVLFSKSLNFHKLNWGDLISGGKEFCRKSELFGPPFCISVLKPPGENFLPHSLYLGAFCMTEYYF